MKLDLTLPMDATALLPHRRPMQLVDTLVSFDDQCAVAEATPGAACPLLDDDGTLDEVALVELMAQGYAVIKGYHDLLRGSEISKGYLVGIRKLAISRRARAGDKLQIRIRTVGSFEGFAVAEGEIERDGEIIASGVVKLWIAGQAASAGGAA